MRARGSSVYLKKSPFQQPPTPTPLVQEVSVPEPVKTQTKPSVQQMTEIFSDFGPMSYNYVKDAFSGDYQKIDASIMDNHSQASTARTNSVVSFSRTSSTNSEYVPFEDELKIHKFVRSMVICPQQEEGHQLIQSLFPETEHSSSYLDAKNPLKLDMAAKKINHEEYTETFHFWLKQSEVQNGPFSSLFNTYYKSCLVFFLIYNKNDKLSLQALDYEVRRIHNNNSNKQVVLMLIEYDGPHGECPVSSEDVSSFKDIYKVGSFIEAGGLAGRLGDIKSLLKALAK